MEESTALRYSNASGIAPAYTRKKISHRMCIRATILPDEVQHEKIMRRWHGTHIKADPKSPRTIMDAVSKKLGIETLDGWYFKSAPEVMGQGGASVLKMYGGLFHALSVV